MIFWIFEWPLTSLLQVSPVPPFLNHAVKFQKSAKNFSLKKWSPLQALWTVKKHMMVSRTHLPMHAARTLEWPFVNREETASPLCIASRDKAFATKITLSLHIILSHITSACHTTSSNTLFVRRGGDKRAPKKLVQGMTCFLVGGFPSMCSHSLTVWHAQRVLCWRSWIISANRAE